MVRDSGQGYPASGAVAVTTHDTNKLSRGVTRGVYVGGAGNLVVDMAETGTTITFSGVPAGTFLPISVIRIKTASTATLILALY